QALRAGTRHVAPDRADLHLERPGAPSQSLTDSAIAEDAKRLPRQLGPRRRRRAGHAPLAPPGAAPERRIDLAEAPRQREHRADDVLGDADLVAIGVRERGSHRQRRPVDAIEPRPGPLKELQPFPGPGLLPM